MNPLRRLQAPLRSPASGLARLNAELLRQLTVSPAVVARHEPRSRACTCDHERVRHVADGDNGEPGVVARPGARVGDVEGAAVADRLLRSARRSGRVAPSGFQCARDARSGGKYEVFVSRLSYFLYGFSDGPFPAPLGPCRKAPSSRCLRLHPSLPDAPREHNLPTCDLPEPVYETEIQRPGCS